MHPNSIFRGESEARALATARARGFGCLTLAHEGRVLAAHVPFLLGEDGRLESHLVRGNPIHRVLRAGACEALMVVSGPDAYVSPDWYGSADKVPTWNYVAVHLRGTLALSQTPLRGHLDRLSERFEAELAPKPVWRSDKMTPDLLDRLMRAIDVVELEIAEVDSTFKLNQNREPEERAGVVAALAEGGTPGQETRELAELMRALDAGETG